MSAHPYAAGQVWAYRTRPGEEGSRLRIHAVETVPGSDEPAYHVTLSGLGIQLGHLPLSRQSLDASVTELSETDAAFPDPTEGVAAWREGGGGVFTVPVAGVVQMMADALDDANEDDDGVRYMRLDWSHEQPDAPDCLVFEVEPDGRVTRMMHLFEDGRFGLFDAAEEGRDSLVDGSFYEIWGWLQPGVPTTQEGETVTLTQAFPDAFEELWRDLAEAAAEAGEESS